MVGKSLELTIQERVHRLEVALRDINIEIDHIKTVLFPKMEERINNMIKNLLEKIEEKNEKEILL